MVDEQKQQGQSQGQSMLARLKKAMFVTGLGAAGVMTSASKVNNDDYIPENQPRLNISLVDDTEDSTGKFVSALLAKDLQSILSSDANTRLVDQKGEVFDPSVLQGQVVLASSGFHKCPACEKIKRTLLKAYEQVKVKGVKVVLFNQFPEKDSASKAEYTKSYTDLGFRPEDMIVLFAEKKVAGQWKPNNEAANTIENQLMLDITRSHSPKVFVFDGKGARMSNTGTHASIDPSEIKQQAEKVKAIVAEANKALGRSK